MYARSMNSAAHARIHVHTRVDAVSKYESTFMAISECYNGMQIWMVLLSSWYADADQSPMELHTQILYHQ